MESHKVLKMREKLLICAVCMDEFDDPRILPCHHTFCLKCINDLVRTVPVNARSFSCPQCRQDSPIPRHGVGKLPVNFYVVSLKDELGAAAESGLCQVCDLAHAQFLCKDCDLNICRFCIPTHRLEKHVTRPRVERIPSSVSSMSHGMTSNSCEVHTGEKHQLFCVTCCQALCVTCTCSQSHSRHKFIPLLEHLQEVQTGMQKELDHVIHEQQNACKSLSSIQEFYNALNTSSQVEISNLNRIAVESCQTIMKLSFEMERKMKTSTQNEIAKMIDIENKLRDYIDMLEKGQDFLLDLQESDICMEAIESYKKYSSTLKETRNRFSSVNILLQPLSFTSSCGVRTKRLKIGPLTTQLLWGRLGSLTSKRQEVYVDKKNLDLVSKPKKILGLFTSRALLKGCLFITFFLFFNRILSSFGRSDVPVNSFEMEMPIIHHKISEMGKECADFSVRAFEYLFVPP